MADTNEELVPILMPPTREGATEAPWSGGAWLIGRYRVVRLLGTGGFGHVYLAHDEDLKRSVAIKVPNRDRISSPQDLEAYFKEAQILAQLDHPHIVRVYDIGRTDDGLCYVVSKFIEGSDLSARIRGDRPGFWESAALIATVAEALHYAHTRGLVHRDIKPANILIEDDGSPCVADFGLALRDEDFGKGARLAGTPAYMSPEQARGEGHRVDGRSDVFSLGVVFYVLLTGKRPFKAEGITELLSEICAAEARPPRQIDDAMPKELERICLKAMSKRLSDRYTTALDLAEDLRHFLQADAKTLAPPVGPAAVATVQPPASTQEVTPAPTPSARSDSDQPAIKVVPKGLRSFDEHDADFFLELLPGPRDRQGLPDSLRFWKDRIEETDADKTFRVGLIYGPSGCGKSSLVKAGLLPHLAKHVVSVYAEATAEETETRLLKALRKSCPDLPSGLELADSLASVRRGRVLRSGQKLLLVLDQFEQWLHARRGGQDTELAAALRHCDGERLQAIVLVRDDFWLAVSRFMAELEIDLVQGQNTALADLFDARHARKVLTRFGQAYGTIPDRAGDIRTDQETFLDQSVLGLAQEGKVVSVRLALFAEMVKGKPWTPATLRDVGGTEGVGVTFLEETFASPQANPRHRLHRNAAQAVLKALLPEAGADIKGQMRSESYLRDASGYANRPADFNNLIRILDGELRLITPTDPGDLDGTPRISQPGERHYQLTHDYLVPSLREWLTRKQRETRKGRAELRLGERAAVWNARPESRYLPPALEWLNIRVFTRKKDWTGPQRAMMKRAGRIHRLSALGLLILACLVGWGGFESYGSLRAAGLVRSLRSASVAEVPKIVDELESYRRWADRALISALGAAPDRSDLKLHLSLALLPVDAGQVDYLYGRLLSAPAQDVSVLCKSLEPQSASLVPRLWEALHAAGPKSGAVLPAASALALYDPRGAGWRDSAGKVADALVAVNPADANTWVQALHPVGDVVSAALGPIFRDPARPPLERELATNALLAYVGEQPGPLAALLVDAEPRAFLALFPAAAKLDDTVSRLFRDKMRETRQPNWNDPRIDSRWTAAGPELKEALASAQGMLTDRFAFCQTVPMSEFTHVVEGLRPAGYRPVRLRPFADGETLRVAAVWTRDGRAWKTSVGRSVEEVLREEAEQKVAGFLPVDIAGYVVRDVNNKAANRYAVVWVARSGSDDEARLYAAVTASDQKAATDRLKSAKLAPQTQFAFLGADGKILHCGVWGRVGAVPDRQAEWNLSEQVIARERSIDADKTLLDVSVFAAGPTHLTRDRARVAIEAAEADVKSKPGDVNARFKRAAALIELGDYAKALADLDALVEKAPGAASLYQSRALARARLRRKDDALKDVEAFRKASESRSAILYLTAVVAAELDAGTEEAFARIEAALEKDATNAGLHYDAACAYSLASRAVKSRDGTRAKVYENRAIDLLRTAIRNGYDDYDHIQEDGDLDPVRGQPAFAGLLDAGHSDRRYAIVRAADAALVSTEGAYGLDPSAHLVRCRELEGQRYRMASLSVARPRADGTLVTASVWHRPAIREDEKDRLAEQQARAAVGLVRMGQSEQVWPLLQHSADPRLRSFIVNWLKPLGAEANIIASQFARVDAKVQPVPAQGEQLMDAVLFHPDTSMRRALILALGQYGPEPFSTQERGELIKALLDLYEHDVDSGIHGAAAWALRQLKQQETLRQIDQRLSRTKDQHLVGRRWYVNGQSQTMVLIDGPVEFGMGSPPTEPDRLANEKPHRRSIPRRFAIADKEVSVSQFRAFRAGHDHETKYGREDDAPVNSVSWHLAAEYCNWLSKQEVLPECYEPGEQGTMKIKQNVESLNGYRLPTEGEWEYVARAGALTSRHYGNSEKLLGEYAWYEGNSENRSRSRGSLEPNDLGLFDILGNVYEWCQDRAILYTVGNDGKANDNINKLLHDNMILRGGSFFSQPADARSANRDWGQPSNRNISNGFRPSRTYP